MYRDQVQIARIVYRQCAHAIDALVPLPLAHRSVLIKCCQAQYIPPITDVTSPLSKMIRALPPILVPRRWSQSATVYREVISYFQSFTEVQDPVRAAVILDLCRALPITQMEVDAAKQKSWQKEGVCIENRKEGNVVNWEPIFDIESINESMVPGVPPNPTMSKSFLSALLLWRRKCRNSLLIPRATHKNMSRDTRRAYQELTGDSLKDTPIFSQKNWLQVYHHRRVKLGGCSELRQKWYPSGAKPRTYYAQGGFHYQHSAHLQTVFTNLVNSHPITHHVTRLLPQRLLLQPGSRARIYDLSTFTSNMSEQKRFVMRLAEFSRGTEVRVFDVVEGIVHRDLGDLLDEYVDACVRNPEVSYERIRDVPDDFTTFHGTASLLGIFGNLMTCTFAHGSVIAQNVADDDQANVAGDDGIVDENERNAYEVDISIRTLGDYEREKTFASTDDGAIALKRPIHQEGSRLVSGIMIIPPNISFISHILYQIPDLRYSYHDEDMSTFDRVSMVGKDLFRFLRSAHRYQEQLNDDMLEEVVGIVLRTRQLARNFVPNIPESGCLKQCGDTVFWPSAPDVQTLRDEDPLETLIRNRYRGNITTFRKELLDPPERSYDMQVDDVFFANSDYRLSMLVTLGYVTREPTRREYSGSDGLRALRKSFDPAIPDVYEYRVISPIPSVLYDHE